MRERRRRLMRALARRWKTKNATDPNSTRDLFEGQ